MLFLLTGDVQIGKTGWLEDLCASLQAAGTCVAGVVAPGQWVPRPEGQPGGKHSFDGAGRFEKLGIDNVLLPQSKRIGFARRRDLAAGGKAFAEGVQAKAAKLGWAISDTAIAQVNAHFATLAKQAANETRLAPHAMLVVDELGRLELLRGCGLTNALVILDAGTNPARKPPRKRHDQAPCAMRRTFGSPTPKRARLLPQNADPSLIGHKGKPRRNGQPDSIAQNNAAPQPW